MNAITLDSGGKDCRLAEALAIAGGFVVVARVTLTRNGKVLNHDKTVPHGNIEIPVDDIVDDDDLFNLSFVKECVLRVIKCATELGVKHVIIGVDSPCPNYRRLYRRNGFTIVDLIEHMQRTDIVLECAARGIRFRGFKVTRKVKGHAMEHSHTEVY